jgi:hypothetical protein
MLQTTPRLKVVGAIMAAFVMVSGLVCTTLFASGRRSMTEAEMAAVKGGVCNRCCDPTGGAACTMGPDPAPGLTNCVYDAQLGGCSEATRGMRCDVLCPGGAGPKHGVCENPETGAECWVTPRAVPCSTVERWECTDLTNGCQCLAKAGAYIPCGTRDLCGGTICGEQ